MRSLLRYLLKNYAFLLFLLLEVFSFVLIFNFNNFQKVKYLNSANRVSASLYGSFNAVSNYFKLAGINHELSDENARLKAMLFNRYALPPDRVSIHQPVFPSDSVFQLISARVINNSVNDPYNYITLDKGSRDGIKPDQGIVSAGGIVGVVSNVSSSYAVGLSLLNQRWNVSARLKRSGYFGPLSWDGNDYRSASLREIPFYVQINTGDTVVTSGFSSIFPEGILIGTIQSFSQPEGDNYYDIKVKLSVDFKALSFVQIVDNKRKEEVENLERIRENNAGAD